MSEIKVGDQYKHRYSPSMICTVLIVTNKSVIFQDLNNTDQEVLLSKNNFSTYWIKIPKKIIHTRTLMWFKNGSGKVYSSTVEAHELVGWLNIAQRNMWTILKQEEISFEEEVD